MLKCLGDVSIDEINDANIPVNISIDKDKIEGANGKWYLRASNYCPRKNYIFEGVFHFEADRKEEFIPFLEKTKALYQAALQILNNMIDGQENNFYYWS